MQIRITCEFGHFRKDEIWPSLLVGLRSQLQPTKIMIYSQHKQVTWTLFLALVVSPSFSQTFFLDDNGVTIKCVDCQPGDQGVVNGVTYTAVDNEMLLALKGDWSVFPLPGGSMPDPNSFEQICTSLVSNLDFLFHFPQCPDIPTGQVFWDPNVASWDVSNVTSMQGFMANSAHVGFNPDLSFWDVGQVSNLDHAFQCSVFDGDISSWNTSAVTTMNFTFSGGYFVSPNSNCWFQSPNYNPSFYTTSSPSGAFPDFNYGSPGVFNTSLEFWDVSNVTSFEGTFLATDYNQSLDAWDVSSAETMRFMFGMTSAIQSIESWDVSGVEDMRYMFWESNFNQDISSWDVSGVQDMSSMFASCANFNQPLNAWDVSSVNDMGGMFINCSSFNQPVHAWDVSNVVNMAAMFAECSSFNQPLNAWDVSSVIEMDDMFEGCSLFNQDLCNWDVSRVEDMSYMFKNCTSFNGNITTWSFWEGTWAGDELDSGLSVDEMFWGCTSFNQPIGSWDVSSFEDMEDMFRGCTSFNQPLGSWDVSGVEYMDGMFAGCSSFNQDLSNWCVEEFDEVPDEFSDGANQFQPSNWPQWGTCPDPESSPAPLECVLIQGCTDPVACNYNPAAVEDDQSCAYADLYFDCQGNCLNDADGDGVCDELEIAGCQYEWACNYNPDATEEDGSCTFPGQPCDDGDPNTTNDVLDANCDCGGEVSDVSEKWWDLRIYPSPSSGLLTLSCSVPIQVEMAVVDARGREVMPNHTMELISFNTLDLRHLLDGLYHLRVHRDNQIFSHPFVIQR